MIYYKYDLSSPLQFTRNRNINGQSAWYLAMNVSECWYIHYFSTYGGTPTRTLLQRPQAIFSYTIRKKVKHPDPFNCCFYCNAHITFAPDTWIEHSNCITCITLLYRLSLWPGPSDETIGHNYTGHHLWCTHPILLETCVIRLWVRNNP